ncbi:MAG: VOC family protein [Polyangiaceae bacterium]|nr:VOC family protein [Polyangiaceae bacterium]
MRLHSSVLVTRHLDRLRRFYTATFGFRVVEDFGACVVLDCGLSLWQPAADHPVQPVHMTSAATRPDGYPFELCFETDTAEEFEVVAQSLERLGLRLLHGVRTESWGQRTLRVEDPDGNLIEWGESVPCFVRRLYTAAGNASEVAAATGIALDRVNEILGVPSA